MNLKTHEMLFLNHFTKSPAAINSKLKSTALKIWTNDVLLATHKSRIPKSLAHATVPLILLIMILLENSRMQMPVHSPILYLYIYVCMMNTKRYVVRTKNT